MIEPSRMGMYYDVPKKRIADRDNQGERDFLGQIADRIKEEELYRKKSKDSFWERRMRHKKRMKELDKKHQAQNRKMAEMQKRMYEKEMYYRSIVQRNRIKGEDTENPERHLESLSMSYETSVLMDMLLANIGL